MSSSMNNDPDREVAVFNEVLQLRLGERAAYLDKACAGDKALRAKIDALLRVHDDVGTFLENPTQAAGPPAAEESEPGGTIRVSASYMETIGGRIGRYKLLQQIGEGGCGIVYMAEQEEPVRRMVALKVIKLGMDTKQVIARFEAERQALALMDHPNIAKVLDAGATDTGRPFFVMELVRGIRITEYCDQNQLSTEERLKLFAQVCQAIQHAHQKGVIHRDIKPSNILVADHDGVPVPKVIDFGIAKATTYQRLTDKTLFTALEQFIGTPAYMSPEQARLSGLDIDTRTDIYSLGVLLYELLTGKTPFDAKDLLAAGLEEMRRTIREKEPQRPSTRLSTMLAADLTDLARQRGALPPKLIHLLRGDIDWIVMKALEKDRARRYETAIGLAMDVQRHLNNEPVVARPPSNAYRFQKLVRRNKLAVIAVSTVAAALVIGLAVSTWLFFKEKEARQQAVSAEREQTRLRQQAVASQKKSETEAAKSRQVAQFLGDMLKGVGPSVALGRDTALLREILDKTAGRLDKDLKDQPEVEAELRTTIGEVYTELGDYGKAIEMHRAALAIRRKLFGDEHPDTAKSMSRLAEALTRQNNLGEHNVGEAELMARRALTLRKKMLGDDNPDVAESLNLLAFALDMEDKTSEAEIYCRQALALERKLPNERLVATTLSNLATLLQEQGKLVEAEATVREALAIDQRTLGEESPKVTTALRNLGEILRLEHKLSEAEITDRKVLTLKIKLLGGNHPSTEESVDKLLLVLKDEGKLPEAEALARQALANARASATNKPARVEHWLAALAGVLRLRQNYPEAESLYREALADARKFSTNDPGRLEIREADLASVLRPQRKFAEAEALSREALANERQISSIAEPQFLEPRLADLADVLCQEGRYAEAEPLYREALANARQFATNDPGTSAGKTATLQQDLEALSDVLTKEGKPDEARALKAEAMSIGKKPGTQDPKPDSQKADAIK